MDKVMKYEHNIETGESLSKELTAAELVQYNIALETIEANKMATEERSAKKAALLTKLGITADEAKLLLA
jgi:lipoate synthase